MGSQLGQRTMVVLGGEPSPSEHLACAARALVRAEGLAAMLAADISARAPAPRPDPVDEERALPRPVAAGQPEILKERARAEPPHGADGGDQSQKD